MLLLNFGAYKALLFFVLLFPPLLLEHSLTSPNRACELVTDRQLPKGSQTACLSARASFFRARGII
ncbi:hypothetical protein BDV11DRAFT_198626 [Aspergillus similis]